MSFGKGMNFDLLTRTDAFCEKYRIAPGMQVCEPGDIVHFGVYDDPLKYMRSTFNDEYKRGKQLTRLPSVLCYRSCQ